MSYNANSAMAPASPQSAYHLFFRFYKNVTLYPCLKMKIYGNNMNREVYKRYVQTVLNANLNEKPLNKNSVHPKFIGNESFVGMSQEVSKKWRQLNTLTRSIFTDLANEDKERYKKVSQRT